MNTRQKNALCPPELHSLLPAELNLRDWNQISRAPLFDGLPPEIAMQAVLAGRLQRFVKSQQIFAPETRPNAFLLLLQGKVKLYQIDADGQERIMRLIEPGDLLCPSLLANQAECFSATFAEASCVTRVLAVPSHAFLQLMENHFTLARNLIGHLSRSLEMACHQTCLTKARSAPVLVARYLLKRSDCHARDAINLRPICVTAQELGMARETLSRTLAKMHEAGHICYDRGHARIIDPPALNDIAGSL
jgi:CRP-like cAMP-binding protein